MKNGYLLPGIQEDFPVENIFHVPVWIKSRFVCLNLYYCNDRVDMKYLFLQYPACDTCRKARKWLDEHGVAYVARHIVEQHPSEEELRIWVARSGLPLKSFFNTSGLVYKEMQLKDKLPRLSEDEQLCLLASDGKLIKRPLLVGENLVLTGFRPEAWEEVVK